MSTRNKVDAGHDHHVPVLAEGGFDEVGVLDIDKRNMIQDQHAVGTVYVKQLTMVVCRVLSLNHHL